MLLAPKSHKIALIELFGTLGGGIRTPAYERLLSSVRSSSRVRALVLDIDSPGGSVAASEYLYGQVQRVAEKKPVVACIRGYGASGAYLVSCAAGRIVASPGALIGSIGVISIRPVVEELLRRLGVSVNVSKRGALKDMGAFWRETTPEEKEKMQGLIDESYERFVSVVARARRMDDAAARRLATGEVFWASRALELGLIDELGDLDRAVDVAVELSGAPRRLLRLRPPRSLRERLLRPAAESLVDAAISEVERRVMVSGMRY